MRRVLVAVPDLFFAARIAETAGTMGIEIVACTPVNMAVRVEESLPSMVIIDLHAEGAIEAVRGLRATIAGSGMPVVGFFSHTDQAVRFAALEAGVTQVLPRSVFTFKLPNILAGAG
jgi:CheY-like chemotaxis protein